MLPVAYMSMNSSEVHFQSTTPTRCGAWLTACLLEKKKLEQNTYPKPFPNII